MTDKRSKGEPGTLRKRIMLVPESHGMLLVHEAINHVSIEFTREKGNTLIVREWFFDTPKEAREHYAWLPINLPAVKRKVAA